MRHLLFVLALVFATNASAQEVEESVEYWRDYRQRLQTPEPVILSPWRDADRLAAITYAESWSVQLTVGADGAVSAVEFQHGPEERRDEVMAALASMRFLPFERDGHPIAVRFPYFVQAQRVDYVGPADRRFPEQIDYSSVRIRLERTGCFGTCPSYQVDISGDGNVIYRGDGFVLLHGEHRWRIPRANVDELLALMRQADYLSLDGYYVADVSDLPSYITALEIGGQRKFVYNYGMSSMGEAFASVAVGPGPERTLPREVVEIEAAIDRLSGALRFVVGDESTIVALRESGFQFQSDNGARALGHALGDCNMELAASFVLNGAPVIEPGRSDERVHLATVAAACGDPDFVEGLIRRAPLQRDQARLLLRVSVNSGSPDMVALAFRYDRNVNRRGDYGDTLLMEAAQTIAPDEGAGIRARTFDRAGVVRLLLDAGANARARNEGGDNALHYANDADVVRLLLAAGADPNARNQNYGRTPLFGAYDEGAVRALLEGGADPSVIDLDGRTALSEAGSAEAARVLVGAGLDPNFADPEGWTAVETVSSAEIAIALVEAGARLPDNPERLRGLIVRVRHQQHAEFLSLLEAHARALGIEP